MDNDDARRRWRGGEVALGGLLVLLGLVVLLGQAVDLEVSRVAWPLFVIVPGLALLGVGLAAAGRLGEVLATVGGVVTMAGLVLGVQNATDRFDTWAYAWTLVVLVGPGIGRWLLGAVRGRGDLAASGGWLMAAGLVGFLVLAAFFEAVVGIGGRPVGSAGRYGLAVLLIGAGLVLVGRRLVAISGRTHDFAPDGGARPGERRSPQPGAPERPQLGTSEHGPHAGAREEHPV